MLLKIVAVAMVVLQLASMTKARGKEPSDQAVHNILKGTRNWIVDGIKGYILRIVNFVNEVSEYITNIWSKLESASTALINFVRGEKCPYQCDKKGLVPIPRLGYKPDNPGCLAFGFHVEDRAFHDNHSDKIVPCCKRHVDCYHTCNSKKDICDQNYVDCLADACDQIIFVDERHACQVSGKMLQVGSFTFGCRHYRENQRAACVCKRDDL